MASQSYLHNPIALVYNAVHKRFLNAAVSFCFISSYPSGCYYNDDIPCIHGDMGIIEFCSISLAHFCLTLFAVVTLTLCLYFSISKKERLNGTLQRKQKKTRNGKVVEVQNNSNAIRFLLWSFLYNIYNTSFNPIANVA